MGGAQRRSQATEDGGGGGGHNDAVEFFYRNKGVQPLCAQIEVYYTRVYIYIIYISIVHIIYISIVQLHLPYVCNGSHKNPKYDCNCPFADIIVLINFNIFFFWANYLFEDFNKLQRRCEHQ